MTNKKRDTKIIELRKKGKTLQEVGEKYGVTRERVRQICLGVKHKSYICEKHNRKYETECPDCGISGYYSEVLEHNGNIKEEIEYLKTASRDLENVRKKKILIAKLRDEFHFSFKRIALLLSNHYSTIAYLYYQVKKESVDK